MFVKKNLFAKIFNFFKYSQIRKKLKIRKNPEYFANIFLFAKRSIN